MAARMADVYDKATRSDVMRKIRARDTTPERVVRSVLHRMGYRFRLHRMDLPGSPDIVLLKLKRAIFVNGCFWHQHSCPLGKKPKSNLSYWLPKLKHNQRRDVRNRSRLWRLGWHVITVWECQAADVVTLEARLRSRLRRLSHQPHCR